MEYREHSTFAARRLPWLIAAGAVVVYLITLNRWVSLSGLPLAVMLTDASGSTPLSGPLTFLLTYPLRWLPVAAQLHALNGLSALLAAVTLGLLARTVALIPQDRTRDQRHRERSETGLLSLPTAWLPPLVAALTCGLQLAFWQHATAGTGEMINLALLAYLVLCLVEFRIDEREGRLTRLALVYGLATTNNPALIAMFPLFAFALIWIRGREFFRLRFVGRMVAFGLAGLSLYLILPLLSQLSETSAISFWTILSFSAGVAAAERSMPARGASLMMPSWEKYLTPQPISPDHSSTMASGFASTGTKASSLSQPVMLPS